MAARAAVVAIVAVAMAVVNSISIHGLIIQLMSAIHAIAAAISTDNLAVNAGAYSMAFPPCGDIDATMDVVTVVVPPVMVVADHF